MTIEKKIHRFKIFISNTRETSKTEISLSFIIYTAANQLNAIVVNELNFPLL